LQSNDEAIRYVYTTQGVCPPEIHFRIQKGVLKEVRFVGGGCPGNAQLVSRLLKGRPVKEVIGLLQEIACRNGTSCPDQLSKALIAVLKGGLDPANSFQVFTDVQPRRRIGLIGNLGGRVDILESLIPSMREKGAEVIYCLGNLTGNSPNNKETLAFMRKEGVLGIQGEVDSQYALGAEQGHFLPLEQKERDFLVRLPHVISFQLGEKRGMAFYGECIQNLPGFSDFEPFALEMNMVCNLANFMRDETVFPALESMIPQFEARIIVFSQVKKWGHWHMGGVNFISLGPATDGNQLKWGLLEEGPRGIHFKIVKSDQGLHKKNNLAGLVP